MLQAVRVTTDPTSANPNPGFGVPILVNTEVLQQQKKNRRNMVWTKKSIKDVVKWTNQEQISGLPRRYGTGPSLHLASTGDIALFRSLITGLA